jgi:NADH dehydrogenase
MFVHLISIVGYRNRLVVLMNWMWSYFSYDKGIRLIVGDKKGNIFTGHPKQKAEV